MPIRSVVGFGLKKEGHIVVWHGNVRQNRTGKDRILQIHCTTKWPLTSF